MKQEYKGKKKGKQQGGQKKRNLALLPLQFVLALLPLISHFVIKTAVIADRSACGSKVVLHGVDTSSAFCRRRERPRHRSRLRRKMALT